jgi:type I restriction enzyme S subunit
MNNIKLSEYLDEITKGTTPTTIGGRFVSEGINFVKAECLNTGRIIDKKSLSYISPEIHKILNRSILKDGDLLFSIAGHLGKMAIVRKNDLPANTNQAVAILRINQKKANVEFLYYYLCSKQVSAYIGSQCAQSVQPNLNLAQVGELPIIEYPLSYQQKIASVLSALDSKIELNNRINAQLEAMAKTLYDYWFVQFDFPNKNGKPYKTSGGKMVWNEELKREIPEGWISGALCDLGDIIGGSTPSRDVEENFVINGIPWITPKDLSVNTGNKFITKGEVSVSEKGLKSASLKLLPKGSVLMSSRAPVGYMAIAREPVTTNQGFKSFVPRADYSTSFIYYTIKNSMPEIINNASGSTFKEISGSTLKLIKVCLPKNKVIEEYTIKVEPIFNSQNNLEIENQKLIELRDWLLPMLMNGQVKVN